MSKEQSTTQTPYHISKYNIIAWSDKLSNEDNKKVPIVANLFAGTLARSSTLELALLASLDQLPSDHPIIERFKKLGWIVDFDELARIDEMAQNVLTGSPTTVSIKISTTMACNFDCPYCMQHHRSGKMSEETQDAINSLVDRMLKVSSASEIRIDWFGGEPLLNPDIIERLYKMIRKTTIKYGAGCYSHIITNGYFLNQDNVKMLSRCHTKLARVTMDGTREFHNKTRHLANGKDSYDKIIENISQPIPFPIEIRMNVSAENSSNMKDFKNLLDDISQKTGNTFYFCPSEVFDTEESHHRENVPKLVDEETLRDLSLYRSRLNLLGASGVHCPGEKPYDICIDELGGLHACQATLYDSSFAFGNVHTWDPENPLETATRPEMLKWFKHDSYAVNIPECRECLWLPVCIGGCAFSRLNGKCDCTPWKDRPEEFVLKQYERIGEKRRDRKNYTNA